MEYNWQAGLAKANNARRCGAKTRSKRHCNSPSMNNGRCRMHGGTSTGAPRGSKHGNFKSGYYTIDEKLQRYESRKVLKEAKKFLDMIFSS